jgi:hypothetical protein
MRAPLGSCGNRLGGGHGDLFHDPSLVAGGRISADDSGPRIIENRDPDGGEPPETKAPRTDAMTTGHAWAFRTTLRRRALG